MDSDTVSSIVWAAALVGIALLAFFARYRRVHRFERLQIAELFSEYFQGKLSVDDLDRRIRKMAGRHFIQGAQFYSLAVAGFQSAADAAPATDEKQLLNLFAALRQQFGLPERYQTEGWRAGRE